ncbi:MAG: GLUG motif-containing protein [Sedimentisphaerales bacterium]
MNLRFILSGLCFFTVLLILFVAPALAKYSGGSGEPNDPYLISTADDMDQIGINSSDWGKYFKLTNDINLSVYRSNAFNRIGVSPSLSFSGVFDGNNHTIFGFTYNCMNCGNIGIFGYVSAAGRIENIFLVDANIIGQAYVGGLVGYNEGTITNCYLSGIVAGVPGSDYIGGLAGNNTGTISNCYLTVSITGHLTIGGLVGKNDGGSIEKCFVSGSVGDGNSSEQIGGLAGINYGDIHDCHYTGSVTSGRFSSNIGGLVGVDGNVGHITSGCSSTGTVNVGINSHNIGGLAGLNNGPVTQCFSTAEVVGGIDSRCLGGLVGTNNDGNISNCYSTGNVTGENPVGGLAGANGSPTHRSPAVISNCYSTGSVVGNISGGLVGANSADVNNCYFLDIAGPNNGAGISLTDAQMKHQASFFSWDFVWETANGTNDVWAICEGVSYPKLAWQFIVGDSDNDKDVDFSDFAELANKWMQADSTLYCGGTDLTGDGLVDLNDLAAFVQNWLQGF